MNGLRCVNFCPANGDMHLFWNSVLTTCLGDMGRPKIFHMVRIHVIV